MPWAYWSYWFYYGFPVALVALYFLARRKAVPHVGLLFVLGAPLAFGAETWTGFLRQLLLLPLLPERVWPAWAEIVDVSFRYGVGILITLLLLEVLVRFGMRGKAAAAAKL